MTDRCILQRHLGSPEETHALARLIGTACSGGERIALQGELGSGKTSFARGIADGLGLDPAVVSSPTFTLIHEHDGCREQMRFVHVDAYRIGEEDELEALGWEEILADRRTVLALEWPERISGAFDSPDIVVNLEHVPVTETGEGARQATCTFTGRMAGLGTRLARRCPVCGAGIEQVAEEASFCSDRCRMADLQKWFSGQYVVSREIEEDDLANPDLLQ